MVRKTCTPSIGFVTSARYHSTEKVSAYTRILLLSTYALVRLTYWCLITPKQRRIALSPFCCIQSAEDVQEEALGIKAGRTALGTRADSQASAFRYAVYINERTHISSFSSATKQILKFLMNKSFSGVGYVYIILVNIIVFVSVRHSMSRAYMRLFMHRAHVLVSPAYINNNLTI